MVKIEKILRATLKVNNENDLNKVYSISAEAQIGENKEVSVISLGSVLKDGISIASFYYNVTETSMSYVGLTNEEQINVHQAVNEFIESVKASITTNTISL